MADNLGSLIVTLEANIAKFASDMGAAQRTTLLAMEQMQRSAQKYESALGSLTAQIVRYAATYVAVDRLSNAFLQAVEQMDAIVKMSQKFGIPTDALQTLGYAAKLTGVDLTQLTAGLKSLSVSVAEAAGGSKTQIAAFRALGVEFQNADGSARPLIDVVKDIAEKFASAEDGTNKAAWAVKLFGKSGLELLPMLNQGRDGLSAMAAEARRFGIEVSENVLRAGEQLNDNLTRIAAVMAGGMYRAVAALLPNLNLLADAFINVVTNSRAFYTDGAMMRNADVIALGLAAVADAAIKAAQGFGLVAQAVFTATRGYMALGNLLADLDPIPLAKRLMKGEPVFSEATRVASKQAEAAIADLKNVSKGFLSDWGSVTKTLRDAMTERERALSAPSKTAPKPKPAVPKIQLPPPPSSVPKTEGETKAEKEARRALKAQIEGRIATLEAGLAQERDVWSKNAAYVQQLRSMELIDAQTLDAQKTAQRQLTLERTTAIYDEEVKALEQLKKAASEDSERIDIDNKIAAARAKRAQAVVDAGQAESQQRLDANLAQAALNVQMREYSIALDRSIAQQVFEADQVGKNAAEVARLTAEYRVLADVQEQIRLAQKNSPAPIDAIGMLIEGFALAKKAGQAAQANQEKATVNSLTLSLNEYLVQLGRTTEAQLFESQLIGKNVAEVARLSAEYRVLADANEQLRQAQKSSIEPLEKNQQIMAILATVRERAAAAGLAAQTVQETAAIRLLNFSMNEYMIGLGRQLDLENTVLNLTGRTAQETEKLVNARRIQLDVEEQIRQAQKGSETQIDRAPFEDQARQAIAMSNAATDRRYAQLRDPWLGAQVAVVAYGEEASKVGEQVGNVFKMAFRGMEDAFVEFVKTGKLSFRDLAESIISEIIRIQVRKAAAGIGDWLFNIGRSFIFGGAGGGASIVDAGISAMSTFAAQGGIFVDGMKKFANGGVVNDPTLFAMRSGAGLMGEAGPEAILPLARSATGRLGVVAQTGASAPAAVNISNIYHIDARSDRGQIIQMIEEGSRRTQASIQSQIARGSIAYTRPA
jgi:lambda family phage tail tape measure protein